MASRDGEMSFWDHLDELRSALLRSLVCVLVLFVVGFFFKEALFDGVVLRPTRPDFWLYRLLGVSQRVDLINIDIAAQFFTHIKITFLCALVVGFPLIVFEIWRFVAPALYEKEKRAIRRAFALGGGLFYLGVAVGYFIVMPVLLVFFNDYSVSETVVNTFSLHSYISIFTAMVFLMGLLFEFPTVLAVLGQLGIVHRGLLRRGWRYAIMVILILAAVLTPTGDPFTMLVVALPLVLLYELSILIVPERKA